MVVNKKTKKGIKLRGFFHTILHFIFWTAIMILLLTMPGSENYFDSTITPLYLTLLIAYIGSGIILDGIAFFLRKKNKSNIAKVVNLVFSIVIFILTLGLFYLFYIVTRGGFFP